MYMYVCDLIERSVCMWFDCLGVVKLVHVTVTEIIIRMQTEDSNKPAYI